MDGSLRPWEGSILPPARWQRLDRRTGPSRHAFRLDGYDSVPQPPAATFVRFAQYGEVGW